MNDQDLILENLDTAALEKLRAMARLRGTRTKGGAHSQIPTTSRESPLQLSFAQQSLWLAAQLEGGGATYNVPAARRLRGSLDKPALRRALNAVFTRHEALRTVFTVVNGGPQAELLPAARPFALAEYDLRQHVDPDAELARLADEEAFTPFDLITGPLIRGRLIRLAADDHVLLITQHHIVSDGWSLGILVNELCALYDAFVHGQADPLAPLAVQYPDYAAWQRQWLTEERLGQQLDYWHRSLADAPVLLALPTDRPRPASPSYAGAGVPVVLDAELTRRLKEVCQQHGTTVFMTVLAAWAAVLARLSGQDNVVIGTPSANRGRHEIEPLVGFFVNTLALHVDLSGEPSVADLLARVRTVALAAQDHQDVPFDQVVERINPPRRLEHTPIFQVKFAWQSNDRGTLEMPGLQIQSVPSRFDRLKFDLELNVSEAENTIQGSLSYATDLFDRATIERQVGYLRTMLKAMVERTDEPVARIDLLTTDEHDLLLDTWNRTATAYPADRCIHQLFEEQVRRSPDAIAVVLDEQSLTYGELNAQANRLAHYLIEQGIQPDVPVAICVERSFAMVVGLLAILKAGGAYVPLDPAYPSERLTQVLADAAPPLLLSDAAGRQALGEPTLASLFVLDIEADAFFWQELSDTDPAPHPGLTSAHLAYIIYTSGSTGVPKGTMVEHRSAVNFWQVMQRSTHEYCPAPCVVALNASFSFDMSLKGLLQLLSGHCLALIPQAIRGQGTELLDFLARHRAAAFDSTPSQLEALLDAGLLERTDYRPVSVLLGGEPIGQAMWESLRRSAIHFYNMYGPTECTVDATIGRIRALGDTPSIGRPIANARIYLLDAYGQPVPLGAVGELYIGGVGVARGYLHRPELTAERFLADPFVADTQARMYRTGDLARYLPDGNIVFLGRNDHQVKLRGFRIELGEIEARLTEHPAVRETVVLALGEADHQRLVAYVVPDTSSATTADDLVATLRTHLAAQLPDYMVPSAFVTLQALPLTPNGKLDRRALPAPGEDAFARHAYQAPEGEIEIALAALWQELLKVERVGRHDHFFELGGHSLLAVRLRSRLASTFHVELPLTALFTHPVLNELATAIVEHQVNVATFLAPMTRISRERKLPLSFAQQRLWFLAQFDDLSATYHMPIALRLRGRLDTHAMRRAFDTLFSRHEALRTIFVTVDGQPQVELLPAAQPFALVEYDLRKHVDPDAELVRLTHEEAFTLFDLARGPLIRGRLLDLAEDDHALLITQHHIVSDGWSLGILVNELCALYDAFVHGQADSLAPLAVQYPDYAAWQRQWLTEERLGEQLDYWHRALADAPVLLALPTDRPRADARSYAGATHAITLDAPLTHALRLLSQQHGTTVFMTVLAAWAAVLARLSGQDNVVIGTPSANRGRHEIEPLVGFFVNTLALHVDLSGEPSVADLLARVRTVALAAQDHQDVPFEQVVERINPPRRLEHTPIFQVMFAWQNNDRGAPDLHGLQVESIPSRFNRLKFDLELNLGESDDIIQGSLNYTTDLFDHTTIERHVGYLHALLRAMVEHADEPVARIDLLTADERSLLLDTWNRTDTAYPADRCIHELFEEQVRATPDSIALIHGDQSLTYGELNARANQLAHHLIEHGIQPDDLVAICVERSVAMVVGLLAILKAGGAYVPLDPAYPAARLGQILTDAGPAIVLADPSGRVALDACAWQGRTIVDIDRPLVPSNQADTDPVVDGLTSRHLAYVIYTSGSTGTPKGVMVEHRNVGHQVIALQRAYGLHEQDRLLQFASIAFDMSVEEIFGTLLTGATLVLRTDEALSSLADFVTFCSTHRLTLLNLPSMFWAQLATEQPELDFPSTVRQVMVGGDAMSRPAASMWLKRTGHIPRLFNAYGPTEATVNASLLPVERPEDAASIGRPIANARIYLLDVHGQPVPLGAVGELYIGGAGVARGYLRRPELTAERFLADPFVADTEARMYRTGDLARYLPDGNIVFLGRNDHQVKVRGFRIELGEIEARLNEHPGVGEAVVLALGDEDEKRLVAYVVPAMAPKPDVSSECHIQADDLIAALRSHLTASLPVYMVPNAFVTLEALPQTPNGKLDRRALPAPGEDAFAHHAYEPPQGQIEIALASIWQELLKVERIGRRDNFFELGGHSLLVVRLMERLRRVGLSTEVRTIFVAPTLADLAITLGSHQEVIVPPNLIAPDSPGLTPAMLPLSDLTQADLDSVVEHVPGGVTNIQDVYALSPLQEGILFHHLLAKDGDPYLQVKQLAFADRALLDRYLVALQQVVDRHDVLRTAFYWEGLSATTQVVLRHVPLSVIELELDPLDGPIREQLALRFDPRRHRIELSQAPLLRLAVAHDPEQDRWLVLHLLHHLIGDHLATHTIHTEVLALLTQQGHTLPAPLPFRNLIAQARLGVSQEAHESFFRAQLADISEPSLPFGLTEVHRDGGAVTESYRLLPQALNDRLRHQAHRLGISLASLCHLGWGQVIARATGLATVVFGTVLFGRMHAGAGSDHTMGLFINTLPLRLDLGEATVEASARYAHTQLANLLAHEHASLALAQRCSGVAASAPLFSTLLNYRHNTAVDTSVVAHIDDPLNGIEAFGSDERTNYPCTLCVEDYGHSLGLTAQVVESLSAERVCAYMQQALESLVDALETAPHLPVHQLDIMPAAEKTLILDTWNQTDTAYPADRCIHQLFEEQVRRSPEAIAVLLDEHSLTYGELNAQANRLAHYLIEQGIQPDAPVALCVERSFAMVVGLLAILKAGGAYVPLDPVYPSARLGQILTDAEPAMVLTDASGRVALDACVWQGSAIVDIDQLLLSSNQSDTNPVVHGLTSRHLAYVIYTSGSTGTPKGAQNEHRALVNRLAWMQQAYRLDAHDVVLQKTSFGFDVSVWEFFWTLLNSATLVLAPPGAHKDPSALVELITRHRVTIAHFVPSMLATFLHADHVESCLSLRHLICSGEALSGTSVKQAQHRLAHTRIHNLYGPTEAAIDVTAWKCPADFTDDVVPIGRPIANARIYLLDTYGQPVPLGAVGELYIGGVAVARGYLRRPELTAERFLADPFVADPQARMYRTGDLARYLPDGNIVFLGRNDHQVKLRGFRIELGEIEARLTEHPTVREAVVLALGEADHQRLVAYLVPDTSSATATDDLVAILRTHLATQLPDYMVPSAFVTLQTLPLTPNGKLDRRALPAPGEEAFARHAYEAPQGEIEIALATLWQELLKVERVGRHDHFFELGGHSLLAVRLRSRLASTFHVELPLTALFTHSLLSELAAAIVEHRANAPTLLAPIKRISREGALPLSFAQQRLWFLAQFDDLSATYHMPIALRLRGRLHTHAMRRAFDTLLSRHEALRTIFVTVDGQPQVELLPAAQPFTLVEYDLQRHADPDAQLTRLTHEEAFTPFDLARGPLIRGRLVHVAEDDHVLLITQHHIVSDGWSLGILVNELCALYSAFVHGQPDPLAPLVVQYPDYAAWQRQWLTEERLGEQLDYWHRALADAPVLLALPTDRPRADARSYAGATHAIALDAPLTHALRLLSQQHGTTVFMTVLAAWAAVLARLSGQDNVVIGTPSANRGRHEIEPLVGFFVNTLALHVDLSGEPSVADLLARVRTVALAAQDHQDVPFEQVVERINPPRRLEHTPIFQVMFAWQNNDRGSFDLPGLQVDAVPTAFDRIKFDLELDLGEVGDTIQGSLSYATDLFDRTTIERHVGYLHALLKAMVEHAEQPVARIDLLTADERGLLLDTWNRTDATYPADRCIHQLFEEQVRRSPEAIAVVLDEQSLTYSELNARANQLAHYLIEQGIRPDDLVAICVGRCFAMVVGLLAILKAGGAYVPLDPAYPVARLGQILTDAEPAMVLTDAGGRAALDSPALKAYDVVHLDQAPLAWADRPTTDPLVPELTSRHLAYIIYTSGSTGTPKGAQNEHRALVNRLSWGQATYHLDAHDVVLQKTSFGFDVSAWEFFWTLLNGATLVLAPPGAHKDPSALVELIVRHRITTTHFVPSMLATFLHTEHVDRCTSLQRLFCSGEALPGTSVQRAKACLPQIDIHNLYGPTEAAIEVTAWTCPADFTDDVVPIGRPIANARIYLLDTYGQPVPLGAVGELYIGGVAVARGYLRRPELTAERFLADPFVADPQARMYRTGDLARYLPDGNIVFLGRNDHQVKLRGFRIELGEIEARLTEHPAVREAVVLALGEAANQRLVAYVVPATHANDGDVDSLMSAVRTHLAAHLPDYMVPNAFVALDALPITPNGKLDRRALPTPTDADIKRNIYAAPRNNVEFLLCSIWQRVLDVQQVGIHDDYFELGGNSLGTVQIISEANEQGMRLTVGDMFKYTSIASLAENYGARVKNERNAPRLPKTETRTLKACESSQIRAMEIPVTQEFSETHLRQLMKRLQRAHSGMTSDDGKPLSKVQFMELPNPAERMTGPDKNGMRSIVDGIRTQIGSLKHSPFVATLIDDGTTSCVVLAAHPDLLSDSDWERVASQSEDYCAAVAAI